MDKNFSTQVKKLSIKQNKDIYQSCANMKNMIFDLYKKFNMRIK